MTFNRQSQTEKQLELSPNINFGNLFWNINFHGKKESRNEILSLLGSF